MGPEEVALAATFEQSLRTGRNDVHLIGLPSTVLDLVESSKTVGILPEFAARSALLDGRVVTIPLRMPEWALEVQLVHRRDATEDVSVRALSDSIDALTDVATLPASAAT